MQGSLQTAERPATYKLTPHEPKGVVLLILWLAGFGFQVGGSLIHLLLVVALVLLIYNLATGRRTVV